MKNKVSLSLMEQLIMLLVFALAAALCLSVFAKAQVISQETARRETAAQIAQSGAELLKSGGALEGLSLPEGYTADFRPQNAEFPGLSLGTVEVSYAGAAVFALPVAWQEVAP